MKIISESPVLSHLDSHQVRRLLEACENAQFKAGEAIVREGEMGEEVFVIEEGQVRVERAGVAGPIAMIGRGKMIGATAVLKRIPRSATAVAVSPVSCLRISRDLFVEVCMANMIVVMWLSEMTDSELSALTSAKRKRVANG
jgi:CRP-like cAMP-binding protein